MGGEDLSRLFMAKIGGLTGIVHTRGVGRRLSRTTGKFMWPTDTSKYINNQQIEGDGLVVR